MNQAKELITGNLGCAVWHENYYASIDDDFKEGSYIPRMEIISRCNINPKWQYRIWRKPADFEFSYDQLPLVDNNDIETKQGYAVLKNSDFVVSTKNIVTIDFLECFSAETLNCFSTNLWKQNFNHIHKMSKGYRTFGDYTKKQRIFLQRFFVGECKANELSKPHIRVRYAAFTPPTVSIYVYRSQEHRDVLCEWINSIENVCTEYILVDVAAEASKIQSICDHLMRFIF